jgi:TonB family protein
LRLPARPLLFLAAVSLGGTACLPPRAPVTTPSLLGGPTSCVNALSGDTTAYDTTQVQEQPVFYSVPEPSYPPEALRQRLQGLVVVTAVVNPDGTIDLPSVAIARSAHPLLDAEAGRLVSGARLWPGCRDEEAVRVRIAVPLQFAVRRGPVGLGEILIAVGVMGGMVGGMIGGM